MNTRSKGATVHYSLSTTLTGRRAVSHAMPPSISALMCGKTGHATTASASRHWSQKQQALSQSKSKSKSESEESTADPPNPPDNPPPDNEQGNQLNNNNGGGGGGGGNGDDDNDNGGGGVTGQSRLGWDRHPKCPAGLSQPVHRAPHYREELRVRRCAQPPSCLVHS